MKGVAPGVRLLNEMTALLPVMASSFFWPDADASLRRADACGRAPVAPAACGAGGGGQLARPAPFIVSRRKRGSVLVSG